MKSENPNLSLASLITEFALLFGVVIACSSSGAPTNRLLESLLSAWTDEKFNDQFYIHGPVREEELPAIFEATTSTTADRRRQAILKVASGARMR